MSARKRITVTAVLPAAILVTIKATSAAPAAPPGVAGTAAAVALSDTKVKHIFTIMTR